MTQIYRKKKVYPIRTCPSCGEQYSGRTLLSCGQARCNKWVCRNPGKIREANRCRMFVKTGACLPKYLQRALGDEVLVKLWNQGTENRAPLRDELKRIFR